ncbi:hypothetical protein [Catenulispora yoronensis]
MQTTLSVALDLLAAAAAPDGTRRAFHLDTIAVSATGTAHPGNGPRSPENAAVPQILELLSHCLSPTTPGSGSPTLAAELPHLVTGMFRTVFEFASPDSDQPYPTAALLYERITRAGDRSLEPGWRARAKERLAKDVERCRGEAPAPTKRQAMPTSASPGAPASSAPSHQDPSRSRAVFKSSFRRRSRIGWSRSGRP